MSKTIKVITLLNKIANGEEFPEQIKWHDLTFKKEILRDVPTLASGKHIDFIEFIRARYLNDDVEIIEEEPEIDIQAIEEIKPAIMCGSQYISDDREQAINKLIRAVRQLDKQINNK